MKLFDAAVAARVTRTPISKIQNFFARGYIVEQPCDGLTNGSGKRRGYSRRRLSQIAGTTQLQWLGIGPSRAAQAAFQFSDKASPGREVGELYPLGRTILLGSTSGENKVINVAPDESLDQILEHNTACFFLDCGKLTRDIQSRMDGKL